jgi:hypothetical protein
MTNAKLKTAINEEVRNNGDVLLAISKATKKSIGTIRNWFYSDSEMLTNYSCLSVISEHTGKPIEQLLEESETEKV